MIDLNFTWINSKFGSFAKYYTSCGVSHTELHCFTKTYDY